MSIPKVTLGRAGLSDADYTLWAAYVCIHIDEACGFTVHVDTGDAHDDTIADASDEQRKTMREAIQAIWEAWCAEGAEPATDKHNVLPAPPTLPDMAAIEMPIRRGEATQTLVAAMANLTAAVLTVERVAMACARALDDARAL